MILFVVDCLITNQQYYTCVLHTVIIVTITDYHSILTDQESQSVGLFRISSRR